MISSCTSWYCRLLLGVLALEIVAIIVGWLAFVHPLAEAGTNVRPQLAVLAVVPFVGFLLKRHWQLAAVGFVVLALASSSIWPYLRTSADPLPADAKTITVMQYNIYFGNDKYQAMADHVKASDADVVVLHELLPSQWQELEPLLDGYPFRIAEPLDDGVGQPGGGMAIVSRSPLDRVAVDEAVSPKHRVTLVAETEIRGEELLLIGLHPHASRHSGPKIRLREQQLEGVAQLARESKLPAVILTDLNIAPTSPLYGDFLDDLGWEDPHKKVGWHASFPAWGGPLGMSIDHVLVSNEISLHGYSSGDGAGSDHRSIVAELSVR